MDINRFLVTVCAEDIEASKDFYTSLFSFEVNFSSDWFIHLTATNKGFELGIITQGHDVTPQGVKPGANASYLTFVVDDVEVALQKATSLGYKIIEPPADTIYGQRRMLLAAPEGTICDVSSLIAG